MKLTHFILVIPLVFTTLPADAARDAGFDPSADADNCALNDLQRAVLNQQWNKLAMRFFMVSMEDANDPNQINRVRREVDRGVAELRDEYGTDCVLDIL